MEILFNDITLDSAFVSAGRTVTEADIVNFAGLSGDFNPLHVDDQWVRENTGFSGRIAHGLLVQSIGEGLACAEISQWKILAFLEVQRKMLAPVYPGDRIAQHYVVTAKKPSSKDPSRGVVEVEVTIRNQKGEAMQTGYNKYLIGGNN